MPIRHFGYGAVAVTLAVATTAMVAWAGPSVAPPDAQAVGPPLITAQAAAAPTRTRADDAVAGSARSVLDEVGLTGSSDVAGTVPRPCGKPFSGWLTADAGRGVDGKRSMTVTVSVWRAGVGSARYADFMAATKSCASIEDTRGDDTFRATTAPAPGERTVAATRLGDVLAIIETATVAGGSGAFASQGLAAVRKLLKSRLADVCLDPSSAANRADVEHRDPYGDHYEGRKVRRELTLPVASVIPDQEVAALTAQHGEPTWIAPSERSFADLAPLDLAAIAKSQQAAAAVGVAPNSTPVPPHFPTPIPPPTPPPTPTLTDPPASALAGLPRLRAPRFVDPAVLIAPTDERPPKDPGKAPLLPAMVGVIARTDIPETDPGGPGCGWAFTGVRPAVTDPAALAAAARSAEIAALATQSLRQTDWLAETAKWPTDYRNWIVLRRAANNWSRYELTKKRAQADLEQARSDYLESVRRWQTGQYPKPSATRPPLIPTPTPSRTPSRTPSPTTSSGGPAPTGSGTP